QQIAFRLVYQFEGRLDHAQITRLCGASVWVHMRIDLICIPECQNKGKRVAVWNSERICRIKRCHYTTLTEVGGRVAYRPIDRRHRNTAHLRWCWIGLAELFGRTHTLVALLEMLPNEIGLHVRIWLEPNAQAARPQIAAINGLSGQAVRAVSIALGPFTCNANIKPIINNGQIDHAFETAIFIISNVNRCQRLELVGWLGGYNIYNASRGISAVERSLRAAENFNLADVEEFLFEEMVSDEGNVVQRDGHGRIRGHRYRLCANAANLNGITREIRFGEGEVWNLLHQIGPARGLCCRQLLLTERRDGNRDALHIRST